MSPSLKQRSNPWWIAIAAAFLAASHAWALPPNAPKPDAQAASLIRVLYPSYDANLRLVTTLEVPARKLEVFEAIAKRWNQRTWLLALLLTPQHEQHHEYGVNGNFSLQVALIEPAGAGRLVAASGFVPLHWGTDPHWAQRLERIDTAPYTFAKNDHGFGLRVKAEYTYKLSAQKLEKLFLFRRQAAQLVPVLETASHECDCCPEESPSPSCECFEKHECTRPLATAVFRMLTTTSQGLFDIQKKVGDKKAVLRWNSERYELEGDDPLPDVAR